MNPTFPQAYNLLSEKTWGRMSLRTLFIHQLCMPQDSYPSRYFCLKKSREQSGN